MMLERLQFVKQRFDEVSDLIIQPDVIADQKRYVQLNKEYKDLKALVEKREEYVNIVGNIEEAKEIIADGSDSEMVEMAKMQLDDAEDRLPELEEEIKFMLIPKDPEDARSEEHTSELQSRPHLVCRLLLEKKKTIKQNNNLDAFLERDHLTLLTSARLHCIKRSTALRLTPIHHYKARTCCQRLILICKLDN